MGGWSPARKAQAAKTLAVNKKTGAAAEANNENALRYMTKLAFDKQKGAPGTVLDFVIYDEKGGAKVIKVIQEVKTGAIRGTKGMVQIARQIGAAAKAGAKYVIVYPGGKEGFFKAKNVSGRVKGMVTRGMDRGTVIIKDGNLLQNFKPLIEKLGGKVKTLLPHTDQAKPDSKTATKIDKGSSKVDAADKSKVGSKVAAKPAGAVDAKPDKTAAKVVNPGPKPGTAIKSDRSPSHGSPSAAPTPGGSSPKPTPGAKLQGHVGAGGSAKPGSATPSISPKAPAMPKGPAPSAAPAKIAPAAPAASPASTFKISPSNRF